MYSAPFPRLQVRVVSIMTWLIEDLQGLMSIKALHSQWLFALAASLEKPIHCDTGAALRYGIVYRNVFNTGCKQPSTNLHDDSIGRQGFKPDTHSYNYNSHSFNITCRSLLRKCCELRNTLPGRHDPLLPVLNVLIAISGGYFGQDEILSKVLASDDMP